MSGQPTPLAEMPDWHPVHRANALLQAAMLSSAYAEPSADRQSVETLSHAIASVMRGPVSITYPVPLTARLDALAAEDYEYPPVDGLMAEEDDFEQDPPAEAELLSEDLPIDAWDDGAEDFALDDEAGLTAGDPLDPERRVISPQIHVQSLLYEFHRRQRQASLLVAGSIATAVALTLGGLVLVASWTTPRPADQRLIGPLHLGRLAKTGGRHSAGADRDRHQSRRQDRAAQDWAAAGPGHRCRARRCGAGPSGAANHPGRERARDRLRHPSAAEQRALPVDPRASRRGHIVLRARQRQRGVDGQG